jgi:hypothetical protein
MLSFVLSYLRALLIESIYRRLGTLRLPDFLFVWLTYFFPATMFPETENWLTSADEYVSISSL